MRNISSRKLNAGLVTLAAISSVLVTGCTSEGIVDAPEAEGVPFQVKATIGNAGSKAATNLNEAGNFESGDQILVHSVHATGGTLISKETYTFNGTSWESINTHYVPKDYAGPVIGIFPVEGVTFTDTNLMNGGGSVTMSVQENQSEKAGYRKSDLMSAYDGINYSSPTCTLQFGHKLCKIVVDLSEALSGLPATNAEVSLTNVLTNVSASVNPGGIFNVKGTGTAGKITMKTSTQSTNTAACIIPPQEIAAGTKFFEVVIDGITYAGALSSTKATTFESDCVYTYKISIRSTQFIITQATISDWGTQKESVDITVENE